MQYVYERSGLTKNVKDRYNNIYKVLRRKNGTKQSIAYTESVAFESWMTEAPLTFRVAIDSCGCGDMEGAGLTDAVAVNFMPVPKTYHFQLAYITPQVTQQPVSIHEGRARVQFEVNKTELHAETYTCKNGQRIDNRQQLQIIKDSIDYALSNPNVELASINICGYASPESPYTHNEYLATNRSRALAEYLGQRYSLPKEACTYSSVPENWSELRELTVKATDITEQQRADLLSLIDQPTYGAADYDAKERTLKTDARFAQLYKTKLLPVWFPQLRCTQFAISTRLKSTSDERLAEIIKQTPNLLSLNQMFRVARLYPEGSREFNETIATALRYYPNDPVANLNAAVAALQVGDNERAAQCLPKAGNSPEAENARGALAAQQGDLEAARQHFNAAVGLREAQMNMEQIDR